MNGIYNRTQAVANASPYSVAVIPGTSKFIYENGVLIYGLKREIRIWDIHRDVTSEKVVDLDAVLGGIIPFDQWNTYRLDLLYYYSDILAFRIKIFGGWQLIVLDLCQMRVKIKRDLPEVRGLLVRHNGLHLFVVVLSEEYDRHWIIRKFDLLQEIEIGDREPTILEEFGDFGDTHRGICFEIFSDKLYGVSNHVIPMELQVDRSFYKCICITPDSKSRRMTAKKIFRRYFEYEGVSRNNELSLQVDESTGKPMIIECRDEVRKLDEISCRTCYGEYLPNPEEFNDDEQAVDLPLPGPTKEGLRAYRSDKLIHPEYSSQSCKGPTFSLTYARYSFYNLSARTFIDLINDPVSNTAALPDKRFRLRFNSHKCTESDEKHISTQLWPPDNNVGLMNPLGTSFEHNVVYAKADERSMIYSLTNGKKKAIVLISFDPRIRFSYARHEVEKQSNRRRYFDVFGIEKKQSQ